MNLRILKKLSKRAAPLLAHFGIGPDELFLARRGENYMGVLIKDRSCWERGRSVHADLYREGESKRPARDGKGWVRMYPPDHPLKGTPMVGRMSGGEESEWDERTAWEELQWHVAWSGKPDTMTDADWMLAQRVARTTPVTDEDWDAWMAKNPIEDEAVEDMEPDDLEGCHV